MSLLQSVRQLLSRLGGHGATGNSAQRMQGLYRRVREHALETFRNSELGGFEDIHR